MFPNNLKYVFVLLLLLSQTSVLAQSERYGEPPGGFYPPVAPWPPDMLFRYHHASTAMEGALRGMAALRHADGNFLISASQAAILNEQARWLALDNRQRWIEYRIGLRLWREFDRQARLAMKRHKNELLRPSKLAVYQLHSDQFDRTTGQLTWPLVLQAAEYDDLRRQLSSLFRNKVAYGTVDANTQDEIDRRVGRLKGALRKSRGRLAKNEYFAAQRFPAGIEVQKRVWRENVMSCARTPGRPPFASYGGASRGISNSARRCYLAARKQAGTGGSSRRGVGQTAAIPKKWRVLRAEQAIVA